MLGIALDDFSLFVWQRLQLFGWQNKSLAAMKLSDFPN